MLVQQVDDPSAFLTAAASLLLDDEPRHNLVLGIAGTLRDHPGLYPEHRLWIVEHDAAVLGAALQTPPFNLVLAKPRRVEALEALVETLTRDASPIPGVTAAVPEADEFVGAWCARTGGRGLVRMRQRVYQATRVTSPSSVPGSPRTATIGDRALLVSWLREFAAETFAAIGSPVADADRIVDARLARGTGGFVLWEDGEPVSMAGWGGRTPNGVRIGPVYTPPHARRRGYGSAVTAAASAERLATGLEFCFLYTDAGNPTSNRIYTQIGYEHVCDSVDCALEAPRAPNS